MGHSFNWLFSHPRSRRKKSSVSSQSSTTTSNQTEAPRPLYPVGFNQQQSSNNPDTDNTPSFATTENKFSNRRKSDYHKPMSRRNLKTVSTISTETTPLPLRPQPLPLQIASKTSPSAPSPSTHPQDFTHPEPQSYFVDKFAQSAATQPASDLQFPPPYSDSEPGDHLPFRDIPRSSTNLLKPPNPNFPEQPSDFSGPPIDYATPATLPSKEHLRRLRIQQKQKPVQLHQHRNRNLPPHLHEDNYNTIDSIEDQIVDDEQFLQEQYNQLSYDQHNGGISHHSQASLENPTIPYSADPSAPSVQLNQASPVFRTYSFENNIPSDPPEPASCSVSPPGSYHSSSARKQPVRVTTIPVTTPPGAGPSSHIDTPPYWLPVDRNDTIAPTSPSLRNIQQQPPQPSPIPHPHITNNSKVNRQHHVTTTNNLPVPSTPSFSPYGDPIPSRALPPPHPSSLNGTSSSQLPPQYNGKHPLGEDHDYYSTTKNSASAMDRVSAPIVPPLNVTESSFVPGQQQLIDVGEASDSYDSGTDEQKPLQTKTRSLYHRIFRGQSRFLFRRNSGVINAKKTNPTDVSELNGASASTGHYREGQHEFEGDIHNEDPVFGMQQQQEDRRVRASDLRRPGEQALMKFIRSTLGNNAEQLAVRLMNKNPLTSSLRFSYAIHQGTEDSDMDIIRRDLTGGRCFANGMRLMGGGWCNILLGDRFSPGSSSRQRHELLYRRSTCSCIVCMVRSKAMENEALAAEKKAQREEQQKMEKRFGADYSELVSNRTSGEALSHMSTETRTPVHSAMANFVVVYELPTNKELLSIGGASSSKELEIGSVIRLNYRASARLQFTDDARELFGHLAYTGPISHEEMFRRVTTIGVRYYLYNKGKKERKVYIQGDLIRIPINVGVVKMGTQPMYMSDLGATFCLYRKQIMSIYVGEIVLEGNSMGSFIRTGIRYYIGFGEERGVCPVYPNKTVGKARKLGVNELMLHHHMVEDLVVNCL